MLTRPIARSTRAMVAAASLLAAGSLFTPPAHAQQSPDARWQPWLGCWAPDGAPSGSLVCIVPVAGTRSVDVATIAKNQVVHTQRIDASGAHVQKTVDNCPGWESANWSLDGHRLLLHSEYACGGKTTVKGSGVFAMSAEGNWIQVQGTSIGSNANARVVRYHPAEVTLASGTELRDSATVRTVAQPTGFALNSMRVGAGERATTEAVLDVAQQVQGVVAQAWLTEVGLRLAVSGKDLVALSNAGVPSDVIDMLVELSYPERFVAAREASDDSYDGRRTSRGTGRYGLDNWDCGYGNRMLQYGYYGDSCYPAFYGQSIYGYNAGYGYLGSGYYYWGQQPSVLVPGGGSSGSSTVNGRAVNGAGYTRRPSSAPASDPVRTSTSSGSSSAGSSGSSSTGSSGASSSSSAGGDAGARTAKPRTPPPPKD